MRVYFDYNATTPLAPEVVEAVVHATRDDFGNASSVHHFGQQAKAAIDTARSSLAALIGADPSEVVFTGGGTESDNFAIRGAVSNYQIDVQDGSGRVSQLWNATAGQGAASSNYIVSGESAAEFLENINGTNGA